MLELATSDSVGPVLAGLGVALLFEKPSARTRNSSEMAVFGLGGHPVYIQAAEVGLDTRESAEDIARTLGCYNRVLCARVFDHDVLPRMALALEGSGFDVPVVNLLSDQAHPCQAIADALTLREVLGPLPGQVLAYIGDANNMCRSLVKVALMEGMDVRVASPPGYSFSAEEHGRLTTLAQRVGRGGTLTLTHDPEVAAGGADALYTDVWTSMGQEDETAGRLAAFKGFTIDDALAKLSAGAGHAAGAAADCRDTRAQHRLNSEAADPLLKYVEDSRVPTGDIAALVATDALLSCAVIPDDRRPDEGRRHVGIVVAELRAQQGPPDLFKRARSADPREPTLSGDVLERQRVAEPARVHDRRTEAQFVDERQRFE